MFEHGGEDTSFVLEVTSLKTHLRAWRWYDCMLLEVMAENKNLE